MKKVSFTEMRNGTKEDYLFLDKHEKDFASKTADRILKFMSGLTAVSYTHLTLPTTPYV